MMLDDFPKEDTFLDFEGKKRIFDYRVIDFGDGYSVRAMERKEDGSLHLHHDEAIGHIANGGVVIDGQVISFNQLASMIQTYEGFLIELKIRDLSEE